MIYNNDYPKTTDEMEYDNLLHMYVLNANYVRERTGVDLTLLVDSPYVVDKNKAVANIMRDLSIQVYTYVYSFNEKYHYYQEYLMAKSPIARELILNALLKQLDYVIRNGKINEFAGTNVSYNAKNASTDLADLRGERAVHPEALAFLSMPIENGEKLLFSGAYKLPIGIEYRINY